MTLLYQIPALITKNFKWFLGLLALASLAVYVYLIGIAIGWWIPNELITWIGVNNLSFELSHVPLHFFAIFLTTVIIIGLYEALEKSIKKFDQNQSRILRYFPDAKKSFKAIGISLKDIHENSEVFRHTFNRVTDNKRKEKFDVKFLLLDPNSEHVRNREMEEDGDVTGRIKDECEKTIKALELVKESSKLLKNNHSIDYYKYDEIPKNSVIIVDDNLVNAVPYLHKRKGSDTEGFESSDPRTVKQYVDEFNTIWNELEAKGQNK